MTALLDLFQQGLGLAVLLALPVAAAALAGSVLASMLGQVAGLQDPAVGLIARAVAVVLAIILLASTVIERSQAFAETALARIAEVGRAQPR